MPNPKQTDFEPVAAYDRIAPLYAAMRARRQAYCDAIDRLIVRNLPPAANSMIDIGAGDGIRAEALAASKAGELVLVEPSTGMRALMQPRREVWTGRIEDLSPSGRTFDVITCLWNVLGHIPSAEKRAQALRNMRTLLSPNGRLFLDVQNRYNAREYGAFQSAVRWMYDRLRPSETNGDITVTWTTDNGAVHAYGHVFTRKEMLQLFAAVDLKISRSYVVDYSRGEERSSTFAGSFLFVLSR